MGEEGVTVHAGETGKTRNANQNVEAMAALFAFEESTQEMPLMWDMVKASGGVTAALLALHLPRLAIIELAIGFCTAVINGDVRTDTNPPLSNGEPEDLPALSCDGMDAFVRGVERFANDDALKLVKDREGEEKLLRAIVEDVAAWFDPLAAALPSIKFTEITRESKTAALNRNGGGKRSNLSPGLGKQPVLLTCSPIVRCDKRFLREFFAHRKSGGLQEKVCLLTFACLVVDRCVCKESGSTGEVARVQALLTACPTEGKASRQLLRNHPERIVDPETKKTFFDDRQITSLTERAGTNQDCNDQVFYKVARYTVLVEGLGDEDGRESVISRQVARAIGLIDDSDVVLSPKVTVTRKEGLEPA
eukprot:g10526.t1